MRTGPPLQVEYQVHQQALQEPCAAAQQGTSGTQRGRGGGRRGRCGRCGGLWCRRGLLLQRAACLHPVQHYGLPIGQLREGDSADFVVLDHLEEMSVVQTWRKGECVFERGSQSWKSEKLSSLPNKFTAHYPEEKAYLPSSSASGTVAVRVIEAIEGHLITKELQEELPSQNSQAITH